MEVILREDIENLGKTGERMKVKNGYARNFLFPRKLAVVATEKNLKVVEEEKRRRALLLQKELEEAKALAERISKASCTVLVKTGEDEKLYGRVTPQDIASALEVEGITVDKKKIDLSEPLNQLGVFYVPIKLHPEVNASLKVWIVKE